ncbi:MAG: tRNA dihydrouridine synthase DusB [Bacteroidales bacterium]|nr:tRNA dihydrouridine synthase DusB [Bacteroidales bacterium]
MKIDKIDLGEKPVILAPMEDITDPPFRRICKDFGAALMYTEFISSEGLIRDADKSLKKLDYDESERPVGIQIFGHDIDSMRKAAEMATHAKPDLIDINFGCPVKKVVSKGAGSAMMKDVPKMVAITKAVVDATHLPVTVKTRLGWDEEHKEIVDIAERLQDTGIKALTIHGRTRSQMYRGQADWTLIGDVKSNPRMHIPIIGNGDITSAVVAKEMYDRYGVDGIMIGRAVTGNPWIFREVVSYLQSGIIIDPPNMLERINICQRHLLDSIEWKGLKTGIHEMRKHYSGYFKGVPDFKQYRIKLTHLDTVDEIIDVFEQIKLTYL